MKSDGLILFVLNDVGYFLSHRLDLARAVSKAGYDVHVAAPDHKLATLIEVEGFIFHPTALKRGSINILHELYSVWMLYRLYSKLQPNLIHHVTMKPVLYGGIAARLSSVPAVINTLTGLGHVFCGRGFMTALMRFWVMLGFRFVFRQKAMRVIFENPDDYMRFLKAGLVTTGQARVIKGSGVNINRYTPAPELPGTPLVIFAGRMLWSKGVGQFVEMARLLLGKGINARFALVGGRDPDSPTAVPLAQLEAWNNEGMVEWWGQCDGMPTIFAQCHLVCFPTMYGEGVPMVLIEAASCGRAIVTTNTPGCREIVQDGVNGLLVAADDSVALADALQKLLEDTELRSQMAKRGRALVESEFSIEKVVSETLMVYQELLGAQ